MSRPQASNPAAGVVEPNIRQDGRWQTPTVTFYPGQTQALPFPSIPGARGALPNGLPAATTPSGSSSPNPATLSPGGAVPPLTAMSPAAARLPGGGRAANQPPRGTDPSSSAAASPLAMFSPQALIVSTALGWGAQQGARQFMQAGADGTSGLYRFARWLDNQDWVRRFLNQPLMERFGPEASQPIDGPVARAMQKILMMLAPSDVEARMVNQRAAWPTLEAETLRDEFDRFAEHVGQKFKDDTNAQTLVRSVRENFDKEIKSAKGGHINVEALNQHLKPLFEPFEQLGAVKTATEKLTDRGLFSWRWVPFVGERLCLKRDPATVAETLKTLRDGFANGGTTTETPKAVLAKLTEIEGLSNNPGQQADRLYELLNHTRNDLEKLTGKGFYRRVGGLQVRLNNLRETFFRIYQQEFHLAEHLGPAGQNAARVEIENFLKKEFSGKAHESARKKLTEALMERLSSVKRFSAEELKAFSQEALKDTIGGVDYQLRPTEELSRLAQRLSDKVPEAMGKAYRSAASNLAAEEKALGPVGRWAMGVGAHVGRIFQGQIAGGASSSFLSKIGSFGPALITGTAIFGFGVAEALQATGGAWEKTKVFVRQSLGGGLANFLGWEMGRQFLMRTGIVNKVLRGMANELMFKVPVLGIPVTWAGFATEAIALFVFGNQAQSLAEGAFDFVFGKPRKIIEEERKAKGWHPATPLPATSGLGQDRVDFSSLPTLAPPGAKLPSVSPAEGVAKSRLAQLKEKLPGHHEAALPAAGGLSGQPRSLDAAQAAPVSELRPEDILPNLPALQEKRLNTRMHEEDDSQGGIKSPMMARSTPI